MTAAFVDFLQGIVMTAYTVSLIMVSVYGLHRYGLLYLYYRHRRKSPKLKGRFADLPRVTLQLPMFNERFVARRIIEQACRMDYPHDRLQIQVLDDSIDQTQQIAQEVVAEAKAQGIDIEYIHRGNRAGFKAGALDNGLSSATGEFIAIFDADFIPRRDFLRETIDYFTDERICTVQTRWEHINRDDNLLTRTQAIFLDGHFAIEHVARNRSQRFMSFNGTAGIWRRKAIEAAGGWQHDTLTEDLDLSYRAQLKGWKFIFLPELTAPAELPADMSAFKAQQFRWTKGGTQTAMKLLPKVMLSKVSPKVKLEAFFHLTAFTMHFYMLVLVVLMLPALLWRMAAMAEPQWWRVGFDLGIFSLATLSALLFYSASQFELFGDWRTALKFMPLIMAIGVGLCVSNTKAIFEALAGKQSDFIRTPKSGGGGKLRGLAGAMFEPRRRPDLLPYVEFGFGVYMGGCMLFSIFQAHSALLTPFLMIFTFGFSYVSVSSVLAGSRARAARTAEAAA